MRPASASLPPSLPQGRALGVERAQGVSCMLSFAPAVLELMDSCKRAQLAYPARQLTVPLQLAANIRTIASA
jgi:hypothetical protein